MLSHETPGPTSLWPFPAEAGMRPELVHCACLQANASASYCQLNIETARLSSFSFFVSFYFFIFFLQSPVWVQLQAASVLPGQNPTPKPSGGQPRAENLSSEALCALLASQNLSPPSSPKLEGDGYPSEQGSHGLQTWPQGWEPFRSPGEMPPMWPCLVMSPQCGRHLGPRMGHIGSTH